MRQFVENMPVDNAEIGQIWHLITSADPTFYLAYKMAGVVSSWFFYAISNAVWRLLCFAKWHRSRVRAGFLLQMVENVEAQQGAG